MSLSDKITPVYFVKKLSKTSGSQSGDGTITFYGDGKGKPLQFSAGTRRFLKFNQASIPSDLPNLSASYNNNSLTIILNCMTPITISISNPAIISYANHGFSAGSIVNFTTTGSLPTGLAVGTNYYVLADGLSSGTFHISNTLNGTPIGTSGTQSGTQSCTKTYTIPIIFPDGIYTVDTINAGIQKKLVGKYLNAVDPALQILSNNVVQKTYWASYLGKWHPAVGVQSVSIDLSGSNLSTVLGFKTGTVLLLNDANTIYPADYVAQLDYFGNRVYVQIGDSNFGDLITINGQPSDTRGHTIGSINLGVQSNGNTYNYPIAGEQSYPIEISCSDSIQQFDLIFRSENDDPIVALDGIFFVEMEFIELAS